MAEPIRILIADDHEVVRQGLRLFLELQDGLTVVGEASNGAEAAVLAETAEPDVVVMDMSMPNVDGVEATRVQCALAIQRSLAEHPVRVRMGINTGDVVSEDDRYFGRTVYHAARVSALAKGRQILVSDVTRSLVGDFPEARFADRGEHELKGLSGRHRLWEVEWQT